MRYCFRFMANFTVPSVVTSKRLTEHNPLAVVRSSVRLANDSENYFRYPFGASLTVTTFDSMRLRRFSPCGDISSK